MYIEKDVANRIAREGQTHGRKDLPNYLEQLLKRQPGRWTRYTSRGLWDFLTRTRHVSGIRNGTKDDET